MRTGIGYCITCKYDKCPTPGVKKKPGGNCSFWTDGENLLQVDEHWPCPDCDAILFIETADQHRCSAAGADLVRIGE